jgi:YidC/Oxa1 family membrane protein insertase
MLVLANILQPLIDVNDAIVKFWHDTVGLGWGLSIIGLTVVVRLAILPLTFKQVRSMQGLQKLQPEMKKIQERYKEDKKRQQEEMLKLYQEHQINPLGSCLPLVLQLPFFFALYQTLRKGGEIFGQIQGPPAGDNGFLFIPDLTKAPTGGVLVVLLILYVGTQLASSWVSAVNVQDKTQRRLLFIFPIFFSFIIIRFPAGLIVYWITTNVWTIGQQLFIRRFLPPPEPAVAGSAKASAPSGEKPSGGLLARVMGGGSDGSSPAGGGRDRSSSSRAGRTEAPARDRSTRGGGRSKPSASSRRSGDGKGGSDRGGDGNGGPRKAPPPSPRKKKKRSGRRR